MPNCPTCGHRITAAKPRPAAPDVVVNTATMNDRDLFAYYKRTSPLEDVRGLLRATLSPNLRARTEALADRAVAGGTRAYIVNEYARLCDDWRAEANARQRADAGDPMIGTPAWQHALELAHDAEFCAGLGAYVTPDGYVAAAA